LSGIRECEPSGEKGKKRKREGPTEDENTLIGPYIKSRRKKGNLQEKKGEGKGRLRFKVRGGMET